MNRKHNIISVSSTHAYTCWRAYNMHVSVRERKLAVNMC